MSGINGIICVRCNHFKDTKEFVSPLYQNQYVKRCTDCRDFLSARAKSNYEIRKLIGDYKFTLHHGNIIPL